MGQDKGSMIFDGKPLILSVLNNINGAVDEVLLILRDDNQLKIYKDIIDEHRSFNFDLKYYLDEIKGQGPLQGILVGLSNISNEYALILPCDSPYVSKIFIDKIFDAMETSKNKYDAIVPKWKNGALEPLHSIYRATTKEVIKIMISNEKRDVKSFIYSINTLFVEANVLDVSNMSFRNFNCPEDIK